MRQDDIQKLLHDLKAKIIRHKRAKLDDEEEWGLGKIALSELRLRAENHDTEIASAESEIQKLENGFVTSQSILFPSLVTSPSISTPKTQSDCVLIVTVTKVEAQAVLEVFSKAAGQNWTRQTIGNKTYYNLGIHGDVPTLMVQSEMGTATPGGALLTVRQAIHDMRPQAIIMCGIAFGLRPDRQQLGDILVAKQLQYYEPQKVDVLQGQIPRGDRVTCAERLLDRFRSADNDWNGPQTHFGLVLSGEKLVNDPVFRDWLLKTEIEAIGGEMEGEGLYAAARDAKVDWILVKAICDWADGNKQNDAQSIAAHNAANFVLYVLQLGGWSKPEHLPIFLDNSHQTTRNPRVIVNNSDQNRNATLPSGTAASSELDIPKGYLHIESYTPRKHLLNRENDGQEAILAIHNGMHYLVDKYQITCQQYATFLNTLQATDFARIDPFRRNCCIDSQGHVLAVDMQEKKHRWGITFQNGLWIPLIDSADLPMTSVTWWGAVLYGQWANQCTLDLSNQETIYLLNAEQWITCAVFDIQTKRHRQFPWGDIWDKQSANTASYWIDDIIVDYQALQRLGAEEKDRFRPLPVTWFSDGESPFGCIQMIGNVWEWCKDGSTNSANRKFVKGGACNAPIEWCDPKYQAEWQLDQSNPYIGFRCGYVY